MTTDDGRVRDADQALVASDGAATHLHPSGFDPSREIDALCRKVAARVAENPAVARRILGAVADGQDMASEAFQNAYGTKDWAMQCAIALAVNRRMGAEAKRNFARGIVPAINPEIASANELAIVAIAMEAGTAETVKHGSVHEGAGRRHRQNPPRQPKKDRDNVQR